MSEAGPEAHPPSAPPRDLLSDSDPDSVRDGSKGDHGHHEEETLAIKTDISNPGSMVHVN